MSSSGFEEPPAIGVVGSLSLAVELNGTTFTTLEELTEFVEKKLEYLVIARPTAVNMTDCQRKLTALVHSMAADKAVTVDAVKAKLVETIEALPAEDVANNQKMGDFGAQHILQKIKQQQVTALKHCNTGSLATVGYGTARGVVRSPHERGQLAHCYCTETPPYNQGARLTAYELVHDSMPATLICDSMVAALMREKGINAVFVGADRVVANGDTANKIGTYQLALVARHHGVPFYVVAPSTSVDLTLETGDSIVIEERPQDELTHIKGMRIAAPGISVWNPAFDVTPAELITGGIVTEFGVFTPEELKEKLTEALNKTKSVSS